MGSFSIFHWLIIGLIIAVVLSALRRALGRASKMETIQVNGSNELIARTQIYAAQGFHTVVDRGDIVIMSKKLPFNWFLCIFLLLVPIVGWFALLVLLFGNKDKTHSVTIEAKKTA